MGAAGLFFICALLNVYSFKFRGYSLGIIRTTYFGVIVQ